MDPLTLARDDSPIVGKNNIGWSGCAIGGSRTGALLIFKHGANLDGMLATLDGDRLSIIVLSEVIEGDNFRVEEGGKGGAGGECSCADKEKQRNDLRDETLAEALQGAVLPLGGIEEEAGIIPVIREIARRTTRRVSVLVRGKAVAHDIEAWERV